MLASVATFALQGIDSREVTVEVDVRRGLPAFGVVGLPGPSVKEARERVRAALLNSDFDFPMGRVTANLAPASVRKVGPAFDLPLAVAVLAATGQVPDAALAGRAVCGELSLGGSLRPIRGALAMAAGARRAGFERLVVPEENAGEAALVEGLEVEAVPTIARLVDLFHERWTPPAALPAVCESGAPAEDLDEVRGQDDAKRALEIASAGGHSFLMAGPPGVGKTMLARRVPGILPAPGFDEALEITRIHSAAGIGTGALVDRRPFRAPHHTISASGLIGGGSVPRPGEITLAHRGVLFLDELPEFSRLALEALRQPLESGTVEVVRAQRAATFPAQVTLVAACNPCPCARVGGSCKCSELDRARYARRLSGPLLDRMDLTCELDPAPPVERDRCGPSSEQVRKRVEAARERQSARQGCVNAALGPGGTREAAPLDPPTRLLLADARRMLGLSARGYDRVLRVARTIADLADHHAVDADHVQEALAFRLSGPAGAHEMQRAA